MLGIEIINEVIWYKRNAFPNLAGRRLTASHETILWCNKGGKKREYFFDYEYSKNGDFSYDSLKTPGKQMRTVWNISNNKEKSELAYGKHPTQKPLNLLKRIIEASTTPKALVLDPFTGSSTTGIAAITTGRKFIGIDICKDYLDLSVKRYEDLKR